MQRLARIAAITLLAGAACSSSTPTGPTLSPGVHALRFTRGDHSWVLHVTVASTDEQRAKGLMGVTQLPANRGMAFEFPSPTTAMFWMKDTSIPLSIAFVSGGRIVALREMTPCTADPCPTYDADGSSYTEALEANQGYFSSKGIKVGDQIEVVDG
jgi:Uncharacterized conserved protein